MLFPSIILLASTVFTSTHALALSTTPTTTLPTSSLIPSLPQRDAIPTTPATTTSAIYFLTTNYVTVAGVTNPHVTLPAKTISIAIPTCIQTLTPDKNGYLPPGTCNALYDYYPSFSAALAFAVIFGVLAFAHIVQAILYKRTYGFFMISASIWGLTAFILRIFSTRYQQNTVLEQMASIFSLTISPIVNAFHYILLGHLVHHYLPTRSFFSIRASLLALPFLVLNGAAFVLQVVGATMMDRRNLEREQVHADHVYIAGLVTQLVIVVVGVGMLVGFWGEMSKSGRRAMVTGGWRSLVGGIFAGLGLVLIQIIFSLARFSYGDKPTSTLSSHESYFYILEIMPIVLSISIMNVLHPGRIMVDEDKMQSLWSIFKSCIPCCKSRSRSKKNTNTLSIASSKELIGIDEDGKYAKSEEETRYSPL